MSKKDLARRYATKKLKHDYPLGSLMLDYSDIKKAYEDGYDKAVELACGFLHKVACGYAIRELLTGESYESKIAEDFKKYMEGKDEVHKM